MKRLVIALLLLMPLVAGAKEKVEQKYLLGAVPEENGMIIYKKSFTIENRSEQEAKAITAGYLKTLLSNAIQGQRSRLISDGTTDDVIVAKVEEYMVFAKKFLNFDRTRFRYQISANVEGKTISLQISQLSYYYNEDQNGENGVNIKAESWITDKEAVNKAGTKLYPKSGKFRIKTIDRIESIFEGFLDAFDTNKDEGTGKRIRGGITEN